MSFRKSFRNTRRSGRFNPDDSRGSTPEKYGRGGAPLPFRPPVRNQHFDPKEFIVAECTERDIEVYKQIFDFFDTDDDGMLTPMDLRKVLLCDTQAMMQYGGYKCQKGFVYQVFAIYDTDLSGEINFKEFVKMMTLKPCENDKPQDIERVFNQIDLEQKGYISESDIMALVEDLKEDIPVEEVREMIKKCDPNGDGKISWEAFLAFNKKKKF